LVSGFCIFHDKDYVQDKTNNEEHKRAVLDRLKRKVNLAISNNEPLLCIGFHLPEFSLSNLSINNTFTISIYFNSSQFLGEAFFAGARFYGAASFFQVKFQEVSFAGARFYGLMDFRTAYFQRLADFSTAYFHGLASFSEAHFHGHAIFLRAHFHILLITPEGAKSVGAWFMQAHFHGTANFFETTFEGEVYFFKPSVQGETDFSKPYFREANFNNSEFHDITYFSGTFNNNTEFHYVVFRAKEKVIFNVESLSNVSFMKTDITGIEFSEKARWGDRVKDRFKVLDERQLEEKIKESDSQTTKDLNLGSIKAVYRNLRENYEYRMRYDEAGQFFVREMELKRKYREVVSPKDDGFEVKVKQNNLFRRNLFSLTGWYYILSRYGESIRNPSVAGLVIVFLSTLLWLMQENPELEPLLPIFQSDDDATNNVTSKFVGFDKFGDRAHWLKAIERSIADFIPLLPLGSNIHVGIIDYVIKIVGGAVTFGLIAIALRRRFERRYRH